MDSLVVEVPFVALVALNETAEEASAPVGTGDLVLQQVDDGWIGTLGVEIFESVDAVPQISERFVVELVHWAAV